VIVRHVAAEFTAAVLAKSAAVNPAKRAKLRAVVEPLVLVSAQQLIASQGAAPVAAELAQAQAQLAAAQAQLAADQVALRQTSIIAPAGGVVVGMSVTVSLS
jgi:multidrug resistance efflux pump